MINKNLGSKNKKNTRMLAFILTLLIAFGGAFPAYATNVNNNDIIDNSKVASIKNYENWLKNNCSTDEKDLEKFQRLTEKQKVKFINYLNDPELLVNALSTSLEPGESKNFDANDDILVTLSETIEPINTSSQQDSLSSIATEEFRKASYIKSVSFFGVKVLEVTSWIRYSHDGESIIEIQGSAHYTSVNYNPLLSSEWTDPVTWGEDGDTAYSTADVVFGAFIEGYGIKYGSGESLVWGDIYNDAGGHVVEN